MALRAEYAPYTLRFRETAITSRASMDVKDTFFLRLTDSALPGRSGIGEVALFRGLSAEDTPGFEQVLRGFCREVSGRCLSEVALDGVPSCVRFGFETATTALYGGAEPTPWQRGERGIRTNGLIWMGDRRAMKARIREKLDARFHCVKMKIGGIDFKDELALLRDIRREFGPDDIELRLDANGAFTPENAYDRIGYLSELSIHSIEQPIKAGQPEAMARVCERALIPVALDEELIGITSDERKSGLLDLIRPHYIILKPSLCGGFAQADAWIREACRRGIGWWATSALESDIGLNAIAGWVSRYAPELPQGLGTGRLYTNNVPSPLALRGDELWTDADGSFSIPSLDWKA